MHISRMNMDWIAASFMHAITAAVEDLSLSDLWDVKLNKKRTWTIMIKDLDNINLLIYI